MARSRNSDTKTSFPCSRRRSSTRKLGRICSAKPARNTLFPSRSTTTGSRCITRTSATGAPLKWAHTATPPASWRRPCEPPASTSAFPATVPSTTSSSIPAGRSIPTSATRNSRPFTAPPTPASRTRTRRIGQLIPTRHTWTIGWPPYALRRAGINYKDDAFPPSAAVLDIERGQSDQILPRFWQTDTSVSVKSWGYIDHDTFRSPESLVQELVDIVSKNGALLLNVGPKSDGTIPEQAANVLLAMGRWLSVNGEAIYGTRPWKISGEGPPKVVGGSFNDTATKPYTSRDIRFTTRDGLLYAIALAWPQDGKIKMQSLARGSKVMESEVAGVQLLGSGDKLKWTRDNSGLEIEMPAARTGEFAWVFKITPAGLKQSTNGPAD